jgi:hypothetical protein
MLMSLQMFLLCSQALAQFPTPPGPSLPFPPQIAWILDNRCITCHDSVNPRWGRLMLNRWVPTQDAHPGFVHLNERGEQAPSRLTFQAMLYRITTNNLDVQMPLGGKLKPQELGPLVEWLRQQIQDPRPGDQASE